VGQRVHAPAGHGGDAMQHLERDVAARAAATKLSAMAASAMLMPPDADPVMPASGVVTDAIPRTCPSRLVRTSGVISQTTSPAATESANSWTRRGPRYFGRYVVRVLAIL
jgi:hypothetical protein